MILLRIQQRRAGPKDPFAASILFFNGLLDPQGRAIWRDRFATWNEASDDERLRRENDERWRQFAPLIGAFVNEQGHGVPRRDLNPVEFAPALATLLIGTAMRLVRDEDPATVERGLAVLDRYIETVCEERGLE